MRVEGGCHCGNIAYEAEIDPARVVVCHCSDCQILSGSAFRVVAFTLEGAFRVTRGMPATYVKIAESGRPREQGFCANCGTQLYATAPGDGPKVHGLRVGTIHQRDLLKPGKQLWNRSRQHWVDDIAALPSVDGQP